MGDDTQEPKKFEPPVSKNFSDEDQTKIKDFVDELFVIDNEKYKLGLEAQTLVKKSEKTEEDNTTLEGKKTEIEEKQKQLDAKAQEIIDYVAKVIPEAGTDSELKGLQDELENLKKEENDLRLKFYERGKEIESDAENDTALSELTTELVKKQDQYHAKLQEIFDAYKKFGDSSDAEGPKKLEPPVFKNFSDEDEKKVKDFVDEFFVIDSEKYKLVLAAQKLVKKSGKTEEDNTNLEGKKTEIEEKQKQLDAKAQEIMDYMAKLIPEAATDSQLKGLQDELENLKKEENDLGLKFYERGKEVESDAENDAALTELTTELSKKQDQYHAKLQEIFDVYKKFGDSSKTEGPRKFQPPVSKTFSDADQKKVKDFVDELFVIDKEKNKLELDAQNLVKKSGKTEEDNKTLEETKTEIEEKQNQLDAKTKEIMDYVAKLIPEAANDSKLKGLQDELEKLKKEANDLGLKFYERGKEVESDAENDAALAELTTELSKKQDQYRSKLQEIFDAYKKIADSKSQKPSKLEPPDTSSLKGKIDDETLRKLEKLQNETQKAADEVYLLQLKVQELSKKPEMNKEDNKTLEDANKKLKEKMDFFLKKTQEIIDIIEMANIGGKGLPFRTAQVKHVEDVLPRVVMCGLQDYVPKFVVCHRTDQPSPTEISPEASNYCDPKCSAVASGSVPQKPADEPHACSFMEDYKALKMTELVEIKSKLESDITKKDRILDELKLKLAKLQKEMKFVSANNAELNEKIRKVQQKQRQKQKEEPQPKKSCPGMTALKLQEYAMYTQQLERQLAEMENDFNNVHREICAAQKVKDSRAGECVIKKESACYVAPKPSCPRK